MEAAALTVLSVFAFIGLFSLRSFLFGLVKSKCVDRGVKLILCVPPGISLKLEGLIRQIFSEEIPEKLMTDGILYITASESDAETQKILENLKNQYPLEVLPDPVPYCMIQDRKE